MALHAAVHGGPGNCVADYQDVNARFFEAERFFVVEVDQRGTGRSTPSVREDHAHMRLYADISIAQMSADFEMLREHLGLERWLVFGGSWGSTLGVPAWHNPIRVPGPLAAVRTRRARRASTPIPPAFLQPCLLRGPLRLPVALQA